MCGAAGEDFQHFILRYAMYGEEREGNVVLQQPYQKDEDEMIGQLLYNKEKEAKKTC